MKKCDANCDAQCGADRHLWLRKNIFYYRLELPKINGRRRYKRESLHTKNFYEAREKMLQITQKQDKQIFNTIRSLYKKLKFNFEFIEQHPLTTGGNNYLASEEHSFKITGKLSSDNDPNDIKALLCLSYIAEQYDITSFSPYDRKLMEEIISMRPLLEKFLETAKGFKEMPQKTIPTTAPSLKINDILDIMLLKGNNCKSEQTRKKNTIIFLLQTVQLTLEDQYIKFHNADTIQKISKFIVEQANVKGDKKRRQLRYIAELAKCGTNYDPELYKGNVIANLPNIDKTKKSEKNPHKPYSREQLLEIFNPKHEYFKENQDAFWICLIALYTGARANSAVTLQYNDIVKKDDIMCIHFTENHPIKQLKNNASERYVPIHPQLIDLGFVEYIQKRQRKLKAKGDDFIFPRCQTKSGLYNNKYTIRYILSFFIKINVKTQNNDGFDFHSFRKNASIALQDAGIPTSYINDIIGWEGQTTMEQSYSNHSISQIYDKLCKFNYDFLIPTFNAWKTIIKKW